MIDPVDRYIARLYRSGLQVPAAEFRAWALNEWRELVPHDGALWGTGSVPGWRFHTVTVSGLPPEFPHVLEDTRLLNPIAPRLLSHLDQPVDMREVMADAQFFRSDIYRRAFEPFGIARILSTPHLDRRSGLYSLLTLYRRDRRQIWTEAEKRLQQRISYHLYNAASHAYFLHLLRSADRPRGGQAAVVDAHGVFHEAQLDQHFSQREPHTLPFALPAPGEHRLIGTDLCARCDPSGDLFIVWLWPAGPLDRLTAREREIVQAVSQGLSFKEAARKIGVAPSTVANHLYRVYRKLGVYSRTELAALVHPPG
jgi:DNA-binding CsgD family transcriptional regulator